MIKKKDESNQDENIEQVEETNKQLCNNIEMKLNKLNEIGLNLKKENNGWDFLFCFILYIIIFKLQ